MARPLRSHHRLSRMACIFVTLTSLLLLSARALEAQIRWAPRPDKAPAQEPTIENQLGLSFMGDMTFQGSNHGRGFDIFRSTVAEIQQMLEAGSLTSVDLVDMYFEQIDKHNINGLNLRALISIAPRDKIRSQARDLDEERKLQGSRGVFHGIPVIVKDTYNTPSLGMDTTCGSFALSGRKARKDAPIITKMQQQGMIVIGKANLSEWSNLKGIFNTAGWSAIGGQTKSPYVRGGVAANATFLGHTTPSGSSSGSAVAVAAGFAPISFGAETDGSLVQPASRAAVFALKPTPGLVDISGTQPVNPDLDAIGAFTRSATDMLNVWNTILVPDTDLVIKEKLPTSWKGQRIGFVDPELWQPADFVTEPNEEFKKQSVGETLHAAEKIRSAGAHVELNVELSKELGGFDNIIGKKFKSSLKEYLGLFEGSGLDTLEDLIKFNKDHAAKELPPEHPSQGQFENYAESDMPEAEYNEIFTDMKAKAISSIEGALSKHRIDAILAPSDSRLVSLASAAGCPVANVPLGFGDFNGRAHGLTAVALPRNEIVLFRLMGAWENSFPEAQNPPPMMTSHL